MNFDKISRENVLAWRLFSEWRFINGSKYVKSNSDFLAQEFNWQKGILYDFFDENGIIITIGHNSDLNLWDYDINGCIFYSIGLYHSRKEAESAAFTKAFEILEDKLK